MINKEEIKVIPFFEGVPKERLVLGMFIVLLTGFILYQSLIPDQIRKLKTISFEFNSRNKLMACYGQLLMNKDTLVEDLKLKENNFSRTKEKFILQDELSNYFADFRVLVKSCNLEVVTLDFKPREAIKGKDGKPLINFKKMSFDVSVKGGYFDAMTLFYKLEQSGFIFDKKSVRISLENAESSVVEMEIKVSVYILIKAV